jgi:plastocyanin
MRREHFFTMKRLIIFLALLGCFTIVLVACQNNTPDTPNTVHMDDNVFLKTALTIKKGQSVIMANDTSEIHIITNGSWISGSEDPKKEPGAPQIDETINGGQNYTTPPFTIAGTYHLFCTVHPGMQITVIVK